MRAGAGGHRGVLPGVLAAQHREEECRNPRYEYPKQTVAAANRYLLDHSKDEKRDDYAFPVEAYSVPPMRKPRVTIACNPRSSSGPSNELLNLRLVDTDHDDGYWPEILAAKKVPLRSLIE